jgi:hypothetical protein
MINSKTILITVIIGVIIGVLSNLGTLLVVEHFINDTKTKN